MDSVGYASGAAVQGKADADEGDVSVALRNADQTKTMSCSHNSRTSRFSCDTAGLKAGVWEVMAANNLGDEVLHVNAFVAVGAGKDYNPAFFTDAKTKDGRPVASSVGDVTWQLTGWRPNDRVVVSFSPMSPETGVTGPATLEVTAETDEDGKATVTAHGDLRPGWWQVDATDGMWSMSKHNFLSPTLVIEG